MGWGIEKPGSEKGQGLVEYALVILLVALIAVIGLRAYGNTLNNLYQTIAGIF